MSKNYQLFKEQTEKIADLGYAISVLSWDQETYIPEKGVKHRAQQMSTLAGMAHELKTAEERGELLALLQNDDTLNEIEKSNVQIAWKDYKKSIKLPKDFVVRLSKATSSAFHSWLHAREKNNFNLFVPELEKMVALQREKAEIYGYEEHPYNALMDDYEEGAKVSEIDALFADVKTRLSPLIKEIFAKEKPNNDFMYQFFPHQKQWDYGMGILEQMGYDLKAGRQDVSEHPFTTSFSPLDVRVTTRVEENNFYDMLWSCIHEGGHALYEQGLSPEQYGMPCGSAVSLGIHESQSRLYENNVGRSKEFWSHNYPKLQALFPENLRAVALEDFYKGINIVQPSLIRTDADELTYHFHIMIRYEMEKKLIEGSIEAKDLKEIWNAAYKEYLQVDVPSDKEGVLQDVHWSHGGFGYFPTYSLGSFYAAQFYQKAAADDTNMESAIAKGDLQPILGWMRQHIHQHGRRFDAQTLCKKATGEGLDFSYFLAYARRKYAAIYEL